MWRKAPDSMHPLLSFAVMDLLESRMRTLVTVLGIGAMIFVYLLLASLAREIFEYRHNSFDNRILVVTDNDVASFMSGRLDQELLDEARRIGSDEVERVSPNIFRYMDVGGKRAHVVAAPMEDWQRLYRWELTRGHWPRADDEVVVNGGAAKAAGWQVGTELEIYGSRFFVSGVVAGAGESRIKVIMPLSVAEGLFRRPGEYQLLYVNLSPGADAGALRGRYESELGVAVYFLNQAIRRQLQSMTDLMRLADVTRVLALLAICFGVFNTTTLTLSERRSELGILQAIGFSRGAVAWLLVVQALLQVLLALLLAAGAAAAFMKLYEGGPGLMLNAMYFELKADPPLLVGAALMSMTSAILGSWLPVRLSFRGLPARLLRH